jgi:hypothetical protein
VVYVAADCDLEPDRDIIRQGDIPQYHGAGVNKHPLAGCGCLVLKAAQVDWAVVSHER